MRSFDKQTESVCISQVHTCESPIYLTETVTIISFPWELFGNRWGKFPHVDRQTTATRCSFLHFDIISRILTKPFYSRYLTRISGEELFYINSLFHFLSIKTRKNFYIYQKKIKIGILNRNNIFSSW